MIKLPSCSPLKVTVNGFDTRAQTRLSLFLHGYARGICEVVCEDQAEAAIIDLDGFGGEQLWQTFRERFRGPAMVMSVGEKRLPNALWVRKPITADDFLSAIERIQQQLKIERYLREIEGAFPAASVEPAVSGASLAKSVAAEDRRDPTPQPFDPLAMKASADPEGVGRAATLVWNERQVHESCGTMEDAVYLDPEHRSELYYEPEGYLQGILQRACLRAREASHPVRICLGGQTIVVLAGGRQVSCDAREYRLRPLCVMPTADRVATVQDLRDDELPPIPPTSPRLLGSETMLWMVSLWASRGRVPAGTDLDVPVSLTNWPSFPRLLIPPHGMQISALWTSSPQSLMQTAKQLAIPHRYVFSLYSACLTLGLIDQTPVVKVVVPDPGDEIPPRVEKRGLLSSLLRKLGVTR